jgi:salicylate hydroxylase
LYDGRKASYQLHIVIVGCGLGGIAAAHTLTQAGHKVTLLEQASAIGEVGAGIQVSPNVSKLLIRWGLGDHLARLGVVPEGMSFRKCESYKFKYRDAMFSENYQTCRGYRRRSWTDSMG